MQEETSHLQDLMKLVSGEMGSALSAEFEKAIVFHSYFLENSLTFTKISNTFCKLFNIS